MEPQRPQREVSSRHWRRVRLLTLTLLLLWSIVSFGMVFFAREWSDASLFGWPFPFYMAAQGSGLIYLVIIGVYALAMKRLDRLASEESADEN